MSKVFLNVHYSGTGTRINVADMEDLSEVQVAIKEAFSIDIGFGLVNLYDKQGQHITDLNDIPEEYYMKSKNGGLFLVVRTRPPSSQPTQSDLIRESITTLWRVSGTISNSFAIKGVRSRMYRYADNHLGYYELEQPAFFYVESETTLSVNVLFKTEENALHFDSHLRNESCINSPMNHLTINALVSATSTAQLGERIYFNDYIAADSDTQSVTTIQFSTFESTSDEFKYQRIERLSIFGSWGKAESCHLIPSYSEYDKDPNNRLAMSRDLHGWFIHLTTDIPLFYLKVVSVSESAIVEGRYKVELAVVALNQESANMIFCRLIEDSTPTNEPLIMNTSVHVTNPIVFQKCLEWKEKDTLKKWADYYSMDSAVP